MQIFVTDPNPYICAKNLDDKRVVKMVLESCQLLNNVLILKHNDNSVGYKLTHKNHPCTQWLLKDEANYNWLLSHFYNLCEEYTKRYGKIHKCKQYYYTFIEYATFTNVTEFVNCTTNHKHIDNVFDAYKAELIMKWKNDTRQPTWYKVYIPYMPKFYLETLQGKKTMNQNEVININLNGARNIMTFLYVKDTTNMEGVLYIVNNAKSLEDALWQICVKEDKYENSVIKQQQLKSFKYKFLKHQGYEKLSTLTLDELNEKIYQHFGVDL